jgi:hypothetical protein
MNEFSSLLFPSDMFFEPLRIFPPPHHLHIMYTSLPLSLNEKKNKWHQMKKLSRASKVDARGGHGYSILTLCRYYVSMRKVMSLKAY